MSTKEKFKLLFLNSRHYLKGGSERVCMAEMDIMEKNGHQVIPFARRSGNDKETEYHRFFPPELDFSGGYSLKSLASALGIIYSRQTKKYLENLLLQETPNIAHAHNIYTHLTTSVLDVLKAHGIPVVLTLHDYKFICPNYHFLDGDRICEDCKTHRYYKAIQNRCVHGNLLYSTVYSMETYFNFLTKKYLNKVDTYIGVSRFIRDKFIEYGFPAEKVVFIPNFINADYFVPTYEDKKYFLYLGRVSKEKGVSTLIEGFKKMNTKSYKLVVVGDGPLKIPLEKELRTANISGIEFTGFLSGEALEKVINQCTCVVLPSEWYENCPMSILESFAYGKPVIGAAIGGIPELIENRTDGLLFESGNADDLAEKMNCLASLSSTEILQMGKAGREKVEKQYNAELHYEKLMNVYNKALSGI